MESSKTLRTALSLVSGAPPPFPFALQTVIRYVMPCDDHTIKKLLLIFWEIVPKYGKDGKLLHEMILVCDAYRKVPTARSSAVGTHARTNARTGARRARPAPAPLLFGRRPRVS